MRDATTVQPETMSKRVSLIEEDEEEDGYRQRFGRLKKHRIAKAINKEEDPAQPETSETDPIDQKTESPISNQPDTPDQKEPESPDVVDVPETLARPNETLYLETVDRVRLDFDFEKLCSISLSNNNVYACLTCGKYFQGRGRNSHAYFHSIDQNHHVYINLQSLKVYILPENYEVTSSTLDDVKYVADPVYTKSQVLKLDKTTDIAYDLLHNSYRPGYIGMNNIKENDYANVVVQALVHVPPLRNFMMLEKFTEKPEVIKRFSVLARKMWNPRAFKAHVSPHELLQHISLISNKRFTPTSQRDPFDFLNWLLNTLHLALGGSKTRPQSSIVQMIFQGRLEVQTQKITSRAIPGDRLKFETDEYVQLQEVPFIFLSLDLPPAPLFKGDVERNLIPQVLLTSLLAKYDGVKTQELAGHRKRYKLKRLPPFLTFHIKRFNKTNIVDERNPTVVSFGPQNLDMAPYVDGATGPIYYDLIANITHDLNTTSQGAEKHVWKIQMLDKANQKWVQVQDLLVEDIRAELLFLSESYIQIWEHRKSPTKDN